MRKIFWYFCTWNEWVIVALQKHYSESKDLDTISKVHGELDELKDIMVKNIDNLAMRGERLELLVNKTENLSNNVSCLITLFPKKAGKSLRKFLLFPWIYVFKLNNS